MLVQVNTLKYKSVHYGLAPEGLCVGGLILSMAVLRQWTINGRFLASLDSLRKSSLLLGLLMEVVKGGNRK